MSNPKALIAMVAIAGLAGCSQPIRSSIPTPVSYADRERLIEQNPILTPSQKQFQIQRLRAVSQRSP